MNHSPHARALICALETKESLDNAIREARGVGFHLDTLRTMTALELLLALAPNNIRFHYDAGGEAADVA